MALQVVIDVQWGPLAEAFADEASDAQALFLDEACRAFGDFESHAAELLQAAHIADAVVDKVAVSRWLRMLADAIDGGE